MKTTFAAAALVGAASAVPVISVPKFAAGFVKEFVSENNLGEIETCAHDGGPLVKELEHVLLSFISGHPAEGASLLHDVISQLPTVLSECKNMDEDIAAIEAWASIFTNKAQLVATATLNYALHRRAIKSDIAEFKADWAADLYYQGGIDAANIVEKLLGPINTTVDELVEFNEENLTMYSVDEEEDENENGLGDLELRPSVKFIGGIIEGMLDINHLPEISECHDEGLLILPGIKEALSALTGGQLVKALKLLGNALDQVQTTLTSCHQMGDDLQAMGQWVHILKNPGLIGTTIARNWLLHSKQIKAAGAKAVL